MTTDIENAIRVANDILLNEVLPYFQSNHSYSVSDMSALMSQFVSVQQNLLAVDGYMDSKYLAIEQKIADFNASSSGSSSVTGSYRNLKVSSTGLDANVTVTFDELVVSSTSGYKTIKNINLTFNTLDIGTITASTWYAVHIAYNGTTAIGILSLSATSPTLPSGYTYFARVGWIRIDATANKYPFPFIQYGNNVQYKLVASSNLTTLRLMASGALGSASVPTWSAVSVSAFVPPTASIIKMLARAFSSGIVAVCPSSLYGAYNSTTNPPLFCLNSSTNSEILEMALESTNVYTYSNVSQSLFAFGWEDNI